MTEPALQWEIGANDACIAEISDPIKVVRVIDRIVVGGPTKHVLYLSGGLGKKFETWLITGVARADETDVTHEAKAYGLHPIIISQLKRNVGLHDVIAAIKLAQLIWRIKPDIVHTHKSKAGALGRIVTLLYRWFTPSALILRPRKCQVLHTYHGHVFHGYYSPLKAKLFLGIERILARVATDRILVVSSQQLEEIFGKFRVGRRSQFHVVPLGLDFSDLPSEAGRLRSRYRIGKYEFVVGTAGRLCHIKNYRLLIDAASVLNKVSGYRLPKFVIAGEGNLRQELTEMAGKSGLAKAFVFTGLWRDMGSFYADIDVAALTSLNEGTPLMLIEAMACERPVISTAVGGVVDLMGEHVETHSDFSIWEHGVLVQSEHRDGFASGIRFLLDRPELRQKMGRCASMFVRSRFQRSRLVNDIEALYQALRQ
jgi:glycosyltransferase involved in cell wall biosynthesis